LVAILPQADRVLQHRGGDAIRILLDRLEAVAAADAAAHHEELAEAQVIHQGEMVAGQRVPAVVGLDVGDRSAGVALVHGNDGELVGQSLARIHPGIAVGIGGRGAAPHLHLRLQPTRCVEQDRETRAMDLVVNLGVGALQHRHGDSPFAQPIRRCEKQATGAPVRRLI